MTRGTKRKLLYVYVAIAALTLVFQIGVRSSQCSGGACALSYAKGVAWSVIWPVNWPLYLAGVPWIKARL